MKLLRKKSDTPRIAWLPSVNDANVPSVRLRCLLPCKALKKRGFYSEIYRRQDIGTYNIFVFQKRYAPADIDLARRLKLRGVKVILDMCDNHFFNPDNSLELNDRTDRFRQMVDCVDMVTVSTKSLAALFPNKRVAVIDDMIEIPVSNPFLSSYFRLINPNKICNDKLNIVWYGTCGKPSRYPSGIIDLTKMLPVLEDLNRDTPIQLTVISNNLKLSKFSDANQHFNRFVSSASFNINFFQWNRIGFQYYFRRNDICIIPIDINPFTIHKSPNRLVLSLLLGVPVIASKIPSYEELSDFVLFGNWLENLRLYATDLNLRNLHLSSSNNYLSNRFSENNVASQWEKVFDDLLSLEVV